MASSPHRARACAARGEAGSDSPGASRDRDSSVRYWVLDAGHRDRQGIAMGWMPCVRQRTGRRTRGRHAVGRVKKVGYVSANPVAAGAVHNPHEWPGSRTRLPDMGRLVVRRTRPEPSRPAQDDVGRRVVPYRRAGDRARGLRTRGRRAATRGSARGEGHARHPHPGRNPHARFARDHGVPPAARGDPAATPRGGRHPVPVRHLRPARLPWGRGGCAARQRAARPAGPATPRGPGGPRPGGPRPHRPHRATRRRPPDPRRRGRAAGG